MSNVHFSLLRHVSTFAEHRSKREGKAKGVKYHNAKLNFFWEPDASIFPPTSKSEKSISSPSQILSGQRERREGGKKKDLSPTVLRVGYSYMMSSMSEVKGLTAKEHYAKSFSSNIL